jgi:hypothetical protein
MKNEDWSLLVGRQEKSGKSIAAFCREVGVSYGSFHYWRKRLGSKRGVSTTVESSFTELVVPRENPKLTLHFPSGIKLEIDGFVDTVWLREILLSHV